MKSLFEKDDPSSYCNPIQILIEQACEYTSLHESIPHELNSIFSYGVVSSPMLEK
jgi:hypothetical protein